MLERLHILVGYVGSAALVAFVAAVLDSPRTAAFTCHTTGANGAQRCEVASVGAQDPAVDNKDTGTRAP